MGLLIIFGGFFLPWSPGEFSYSDRPLSIFYVLLNLVDLDVNFLNSYDILRMAVIVPIFSLLLFLLTYLRQNLETSPFPGMLLAVLAVSAVMLFIFETFSGFLRWGMALVFVAGFFYYVQRCYRKGVLGKTAYFVLFIFFLGSIFLYLFELAFQFYLQLETVRLAETYGFFLTFTICSILLIYSALHFMRSVEEFWMVLFALGFCVIGYSTVIQPLFYSGPVKFFSDNLHEISLQLIVHIRIVGLALLIAVFFGVPLGIYITRNPFLAGIVLYISSILITIPSIAMFGFMMPILSSIDNVWDGVNGIGIGVVPATVALALYSLLPIIRNTYIALRSVDPATIEAGRGMGMTNFQLLIQLQLPLSAPIIMAGVRTAVVMGIAIAAIAAYIGAGGLGLFVSKGLQMSTNDSVIAGAIAMSLLAVVADIFLARAEEWVTPTGLKVKTGN